MAEDKKPPRGFNPLLRIIASVYILYLAFQMIRDFSAVPENQKLFIGISIVVFIVMPCWFLYTAYKDWKQVKAQEAAEEQAAREAEVLNPAVDVEDADYADAVDAIDDEAAPDEQKPEE